jgi:hypothetical protein
MNKYQVILSTICLLVIAIFNLLFWIIVPDLKSVISPNIIFSYIFIMLALVAVSFALLGFTIIKSDNYILTTPILIISLGYLAVQFVAGGVFIIFDSTKLLISISIQVVIFLLFAIYILLSFLGIIHINDNQAYTRSKINYIKNLNLLIEEIIILNKNELHNPALKELAEKIKYSDPMSHASLRDEEMIIESKLENIKERLSKNEDLNGELITLVTNLIVLRNKKCKNLKK